MFKSKTVQRVVSIIVSMLVFLYLGFQIYNVSHKTISTEFAIPYTYDEKVTVTGYVIRDEELVNSSVGSGVISYSQQSGSKVAVGSVVAEVFSTEEQASAKGRIEEINTELNNLNALQESGKQFSASAELLDLKINESINQMLTISDTGQLRGFAEASTGLLEYMNKKQIATGKISGFDTRVAALTAERAELESIVGTPAEIICDKAGYFVNQADGYESLVDYNGVESLTVEQLKTVETAEVSPPQNVLGKVFSGNEWYIAAVLPNESIRKMSIGDEVTLYMPFVTSQELPCTVKYMNVDYTSDETMVAFQCDRINYDLAEIRLETVEICVGSYEGLRVNSSAIRVIDGVTGVYVLAGITADFKAVELLYSDSGFAVCKKDVTNSSALKIYDEIIVEGSDLYDGKTVK